MRNLTFFLVHTEDDDNFVTSDTDEFLYRAYTTTGELRQEDHSLDIVVLQLSAQPYRSIQGFRVARIDV